jgi:hypothetical protein
MLFNQTAVDGLPVVHAIETSGALLEHCLYVFTLPSVVDVNVPPLGSGAALGASLASDVRADIFQFCYAQSQYVFSVF